MQTYLNFGILPLLSALLFSAQEGFSLCVTLSLQAAKLDTDVSKKKKKEEEGKVGNHISQYLNHHHSVILSIKTIYF